MSIRRITAMMTLGASVALPAAGAIRMSDYTLTLTGQCPGRIYIEWSGATPNHRQGVIIASRLGRTIIPTGGCAGTELGIQDNLWLVYIIGTESGSGVRFGNAGSHPCGWQMQLIEAGTCRVSNTAQFP